MSLGAEWLGVATFAVALASALNLPLPEHSCPQSSAAASSSASGVATLAGNVGRFEGADGAFADYGAEGWHGGGHREFRLQDDMYAQDSIELLKQSGIDFAQNEARGIDVHRFGELLMSSGIVLNEEVRQIFSPQNCHHCMSRTAIPMYGYVSRVLYCVVRCIPGIWNAGGFLLHRVQLGMPSCHLCSGLRECACAGVEEGGERSGNHVVFGPQ